MSDSSEHKSAMKRLQTEHRRKIKAAKDPQRGLILVHTGDGKGKSSSAFGVAARALGWGHDVAVVQFIKGKWKTGERDFFSNFEAHLEWHTMGDGFTWDTQDLEQDTKAATAAFRKATDLITAGEFDLVVLDEINIALRYDYLDVAAVIAALEQRHNRTSVILTGRDARPELVEYADLVTEMREVKHPFKKGIKAQPGIDY
ncbi:MAG: cob(I)yrinic acid a,c-diamide adenosyltransferase [Pseudomonadota bacterium]